MNWSLPRKRKGKPPLACGLDLGGNTNHSALCFLESEYRLNVQTAEREQHFLCRYFRRLRHGLSYPEIVDYITWLNQQLSDRYGREAVYVVDSTGVDFAVLNYFEEKIGTDRIKKVSITEGSEQELKPDEFYVPKQRLIAELQGLLQSGRLHLPDTIYSKALQEELLQDGSKKRGGEAAKPAAKTGKHDDLVTSCLLAMHWLTQQKRSRMSIWF